MSNPLARGANRVVRFLSRLGIALAAVALLVSLALIAYSVVMRYFLNRPQSWIDEIAGYLLVASVMLAAADALFHGEHIAVDIVTERLPPRAKGIVHNLGLVAVAIMGALLAASGWGMIEFSWMSGLLSTGYLSVPMWIPQLLVPIGGVLLVIAAMAMLFLGNGDAADRERDSLPPRGLE
jgi:TRAP-type C4-dicarboxylate transport system permease small subunit